MCSLYYDPHCCQLYRFSFPVSSYLLIVIPLISNHYFLTWPILLKGSPLYIFVLMPQHVKRWCKESDIIIDKWHYPDVCIWWLFSIYRMYFSTLSNWFVMWQYWKQPKQGEVSLMMLTTSPQYEHNGMMHCFVRISCHHWNYAIMIM